MSYNEIIFYYYGRIRHMYHYYISYNEFSALILLIIYILVMYMTPIILIN